MVMFGLNDVEIVSQASVDKWSIYTTQWLGSHIFPGRHFYINDKSARQILQEKIVDTSSLLIDGQL